MNRLIFLFPFLICGISCAPPASKVRVVEEGAPIDTLEITEVPAIVETVYVTTVETIVETVEVAKEVAPGKRVPTPKPAPEAVSKARVYKVQIGAFQDEANANKLHTLVKGEYGDLIYIDTIPPYWKVRIGNYGSWKEALGIRNEFVNKGYKDAWVVPCK